MVCDCECINEFLEEFLHLHATTILGSAIGEYLSNLIFSLNPNPLYCVCLLRLDPSFVLLFV